jgi:hypothetical protein
LSKKATDFVPRFWNKVNIGDKTECWDWTAFIGWDGYGYFRPQHICKTQKAHRISYELTFGKIPDKICVLHRCDNRKCVNPNHLFLGTKQDNTSDMRNKGRGWNPVGVEVKCAKLDENKVRVIRDLFRDGKYQTEIAKLFGVDSSTISTIVNRKSWKHVE